MNKKHEAKAEEKRRREICYLGLTPRCGELLDDEWHFRWKDAVLQFGPRKYVYSAYLRDVVLVSGTWPRMSDIVSLADGSHPDDPPLHFGGTFGKSDDDPKRGIVKVYTD